MSRGSRGNATQDAPSGTPIAEPDEPQVQGSSGVAHTAVPPGFEVNFDLECLLPLPEKWRTLSGRQKQARDENSLIFQAKVRRYRKILKKYPRARFDGIEPLELALRLELDGLLHEYYGPQE